VRPSALPEGGGEGIHCQSHTMAIPNWLVITKKHPPSKVRVPGGRCLWCFFS